MVQIRSTRSAARVLALAAQCLLGECLFGVVFVLPSACSTNEASSNGSSVPVGLGLACASDPECSSGLCLRETKSGSNVSWTGGSCSRVCGSTNACPTDATCVAFGDGSSLCLTHCSKNGDCRSGYVCSTAVSACLPDCRLGFSCGTSLTCEQSSGNCVVPIGTQPIGGKCTLNTDCKSSLCSPEQSNSSGKQWAEGYCTSPCSASNSCSDGATCLTYADGSSYCAATCSSNPDCRNGYICSASSKVCLPDCRQGWSCGSSLVCDNGSGNCVGKMLQIGEPCSLNIDCASDLCTPSQSTSSGTVWNGGYCTQTCSSSNACPGSATCLTYGDGSSYCAASCSGKADCRAGYVCSDSAKVCLPDCRQGWSCGSSLICDPDSGNCVGKMLPIGEACTQSIDCASLLCTPAESTSGGTVWDGGYCTQQCGDTTACPASTQCISYQDGGAYCAAGCSSDKDCRANYVCATSVGACLPDCRKGWSCGSSLACNTTNGTCG